jgi:two-component system, sensor histidine kinase and response regulator
LAGRVAPRVLIVDDQPLNRALLEAQLRDDGYAVIGAPDGEAGLKAAIADPPSLVLLDVLMPGLSGFDVLAQLKAHERTRDVPVVLVTSLSDPDSRLRGLAAGADDFLCRPVDRAELSARVRSLVRSKALNDELQRALREAAERADHPQAEAALRERLRWESEVVHQLLGKVMAAKEDESKRVARDLHDGPVQDLAALLVALDSLKVGPALMPQQDALLRRIRMQAGVTLQEFRRFLGDLRPCALDELGLVAAVGAFVDTRLAGLGIDGQMMTLGGERRLAPELEIAVFRIVQEAVDNAAKHARPRRVQVCLDFSAAAVTALVADDGIGFEPSAYQGQHTSSGLGLAAMRERAILAGGTLDIASQPGQGTRITARIPTPERDGRRRELLG